MWRVNVAESTRGFFPTFHRRPDLFGAERLRTPTNRRSPGWDRWRHDSDDDLAANACALAEKPRRSCKQQTASYFVTANPDDPLVPALAAAAFMHPISPVA